MQQSSSSRFIIVFTMGCI